LQGIAFHDLPEGTYYATASLFTKPKPDTPATLSFNFGPAFKYPMHEVAGLPQPRPFCEVERPKLPPAEDGAVTVSNTPVAMVADEHTAMTLPLESADLSNSRWMEIKKAIKALNFSPSFRAIWGSSTTCLVWTD
jgi:hypothetical protein